MSLTCENSENPSMLIMQTIYQWQHWSVSIYRCYGCAGLVLFSFPFSCWLATCSCTSPRKKFESKTPGSFHLEGNGDYSDSNGQSQMPMLLQRVGAIIPLPWLLLHKIMTLFPCSSGIFILFAHLLKSFAPGLSCWKIWWNVGGFPYRFSIQGD